jgi:hypothetical protein
LRQRAETAHGSACGCHVFAAASPDQIKQRLGFYRRQVVTTSEVDGFREFSSLSNGEGSLLSLAE